MAERDQEPSTLAPQSQEEDHAALYALQHRPSASSNLSARLGPNTRASFNLIVQTCSHITVSLDLPWANRMSSAPGG